MRIKTAVLSSTAIVLSMLATTSIASAKELGAVVGVKADVGIRLDSQSRDNEGEDNDKATNTEDAEVKADFRGNATATAKRDDEDKAESKSTSTKEDDRGQLNAESHRSIVSTFVHSLLNVADREGGIGVRVREVARKQNDSASTTAEAMVKVEGRGSFRKFLFGSDYQNLGVIRSELATTTANIVELKSLLSSSTSDADKAVLNAQINILESEQVRLKAYVTANENIFSLFGWFTKMFSK